MKIILVIAVSALVSCGTSSTSGDNAEAAPATSTLLFQGTYSSDCKYMQKLTLKNEGTLSELIIARYLDGQCTEPSNMFKMTRTVVYHENTDKITFPVDLTWNKVEMTIQGTVTEDGTYGYKDVVQNVPKDITGTVKIGGEIIPATGTVMYQTWHQDGELLLIEAMPWTITDGSGKSADNRNFSMITNPYLSKK